MARTTRVWHIMKQILFEVERPFKKSLIHLKIYNNGTMTLELSERETRDLIKGLQEALKQ